MNMNRPLVRLAALGASGAMVLAAAPAMAKPVWPDPVRGLQFSIGTPAYSLSASWGTSKNATSYQVVLKNQAGTTLDSERVPGTSWKESFPPAQIKVGAQLTLTVTSYAGTRKQKGSGATSTQTVKDITPPTGSFTTSVSKYTVTLTQNSVSDDSGAAVTRSVNWGDGTPADTTSGAALQHTYVGTGDYDILVTLKDSAGNTATVKKSISVVDKAPVGTFAVSKATSDYKVKLSQLTLSDDITAPDSLVKVVRWGDDSAPETWSGSGTLEHQYPTPATPTTIDHYTPSVTISDTAKPDVNTTLVQLGNVIVNDHTAPAGSFSVTTSKAWSSYTAVGLRESGVTDGLGSLAKDVQRTVDWGDGSQPQSWTSGAAPTHVYTADGPHPVTVTLTDEAGNVSDAIPAGDVTAATDATAPVARFKYPKKPRNVVKKWRALHGTVVDAGVGARQVQLKVIEKRGRAWYAYKPGTHRWVKAGTMHRAWTRAGVVRMTPSATGAWGKRVAHLRRGTLAYRAKAVDNVGNTSRWLVHSQKLTR